MRKSRTLTSEGWDGVGWTAARLRRDLYRLVKVKVGTNLRLEPLPCGVPARELVRRVRCLAAPVRSGPSGHLACCWSGAASRMRLARVRGRFLSVGLSFEGAAGLSAYKPHEPSDPFPEPPHRGRGRHGSRRGDARCARSQRVFAYCTQQCHLCRRAASECGWPAGHDT